MKAVGNNLDHGTKMEPGERSVPTPGRREREQRSRNVVTAVLVQPSPWELEHPRWSGRDMALGCFVAADTIVFVRSMWTLTLVVLL